QSRSSLRDAGRVEAVDARRAPVAADSRHGQPRPAAALALQLIVGALVADLPERPQRRRRKHRSRRQGLCSAGGGAEGREGRGLEHEARDAEQRRRELEEPCPEPGRRRVAV
ncbi:hypothetical protein DFJ74DRAFT_773291, partial [Hyaloraphidium curvatum]